jgi:hypothetical protein
MTNFGDPHFTHGNPAKEMLDPAPLLRSDIAALTSIGAWRAAKLAPEGDAARPSVRLRQPLGLGALRRRL